MDLAESRRIASEKSGGTSSDVIKDVLLTKIRAKSLSGSVLDFGAGRAELLARMAKEDQFAKLTGADLFPRDPALDAKIDWHQQDLNDSLKFDEQFDVVICSETIEHLENPRHTFRCLYRLVKPGGTLFLTMPNQESIRSYVGLILGGHFTSFLGASYPAHITALLRLDLRRMCEEVGFQPPDFWYTNSGGIPKLPVVKWQSVSLGLLRGRLFSDNIGMTTTKPSV
jgi:2-polyprenyl-3-methyl-5-hydroxy-6-metoxy-1,4-benzoquinol methylase